MLQDRLLESAERRPRLEPELGDESGSRVLVGMQGLALAPGTVEREQQLPPEPLAMWMLCDQRLELADEVAVPAVREVRLDPFLERD